MMQAANLPPHALGEVRALLAANRIDDAQSRFAELMALYPDHIEVERLGAYVAYGAGDDAAALRYMQQVVDRSPHDADTALESAQLFAAVGDADAAIDALQSLVAMHPARADAWFALGRLLYETRRENDSATALQHAHALQPNDAGIRRALAESLYAAERHAEAATHFDALMRLQPDDPRVRLRLARCHSRLGELQPAFDLLASAPEAEAAQSPLWVLTGQLHEDSGDADAARTAYATAMRLAPADPEPLAATVMLDMARTDPALLRRARALAANPRVPPDHRAALQYALGKADDALGDFPSAWSHWASANAVRRSQVAAEPGGAVRERVEALQATYTREYVELLASAGRPDPRPILIVGMPRSGTTLAEQVLASHPRIHGAGELGTLALMQARRSGSGNDGLSDALDWVPQYADEYLAALARNAPPDAERLVDKQPYNFMFLGLAACLVPQARVVWCRRDPRDIAVSTFGENFSPLSRYATNLRDIRELIDAQETLMEYWARTLRLPILELQYETVVSDFEAQARRLVAFTGLEWDPACLDFHATSRPVQTNSRWQIRRPVSARSVGRWRNYAPWLKAAGFDVDGAAVIEATTNAAPVGSPERG